MSMLKQMARRLVGGARRRQAERLLHRLVRSGGEFHCPLCDSQLRWFGRGGESGRKGARCVECDSLERDRLVYLYFKQRTDLFDGRPKQMLHVAPERQLSQLLQRSGIDYLSADLNGRGAMVKMDITDIQYPDDTFDVVYCSHVLEHVPEDRRAMREFHRVLKPGGWAVLQVPITVETTFEDPSIISPEDRLRVFGQVDHVRCYGPDYGDRLREAGFRLTVDPFARQFDEAEIRRCGLPPGEDIYRCDKPAD